MKRSGLSRTIVAIAMMLIGWLPSLAYDFEVDGIFYNITSSSEPYTVAVNSCRNRYGDLKIPESVVYNGISYLTTSIETTAFSGFKNLESVEISNAITSIGDYAFQGCSGLTSMTIPNSVTSIGDYAFQSCSGLTNVTFGNSVISIGERAFSNCTGLTSVIISNSVTTIGEKAFFNCSGLTSITIGNSVNLMGKDAFYGCSSLASVIWNAKKCSDFTGSSYAPFRDSSTITSFTFGKNTEHIPAYICSNLRSLTNLTINYSVASIGHCAFQGCSGLTNISIPNSVSSIGDYAFQGCSITSIKIPNSVTSISDYAFYFCTSLTNIEIPNSVTSIGEGAFYNCSKLTSIKIPNSVTSIGSSAFSNCSKLTSIEFPNSVTSIEVGVFKFCASLTSIEIPNSVTRIGKYAISNCASLTSIIVEAGNTMYDSRENCNAIIETASNTLVFGCKNSKIPKSVTSIGNSAFSYCRSLISIEIPNSVTSIGMCAFESCSSLTGIEIPNSVTSIGDYALSSCTGLTQIKCLSIIPPSISSLTFYIYNPEACLYVPAGCKSTYESAEYWRNFSNIIELEENSTSSRFFIDDFSINASETKVLAINLKNDIAFSGFQADLYLPEGLDVVIDNGNYSFELTDRKGSDHVLSAVKQSNGAIRLLCYSLTNKEFIGNEGALVKFSVKASDDFVGEHEISIKDIEFTQKDETKHELEPTTAKVEGRMLAKSITLNKTEVSLEVTQTITLKATVLPESTYNKVVTWKSSDETIATVDENGVVIAVKLGEATITATTTDGTNLSASCKVTVKSTLATSITLDKTEIELEATQTATISATILPELTTNKTVTWKSSDEKIATVDVNGVVTAVKVGEAIITATTVDGSNLSASCRVIVMPTQATSITLNKTEVSLKATETVTLVATVLPELATNNTVTWKSSNNDVAIVDENGKVTAIVTGEATITATTTDGSNLSASTKIVVDPTIAESITLNIESTTLKANETIKLIANVLPEPTTNKSVTWKSSDEAVAIVDANGLVTAIGVGTATITATTIDGSNLSASCIVTVEATLGDANNDAIINVTDVVNVASYILGQNPDTFIFEAADINKDSKISVTDIVAIVNIILNSEITNEAAHYTRAAKQQALGSCLFIDDTSIEEGETMQLAVNLTNDIAFSGFQADIKLPEGLELCQEDGEYLISLSDRKGNDHVLASAMRSDGTIRVLSYSMNLKDYAGTEGALIYLTVKATDNFVGDHEICINNITFVKADLTEYSLESSVCHLTGTTSIEGVNSEVIVATIGDNIVVKNAKLGSNVIVYAADGRIISTEVATDGDVVAEAPAKGIYVVAIDGKSFKVMVK